MSNYEYDDYQEQNEGQQTAKSIKGYKVIIMVLAIILAALSFLYFHQTSTIKEEARIERDTLKNQISRLMDDYSDLRTENDTIARNLDIERERADSLMESLDKERTLSRAKIRQYEKELGTLRTVMRTYVHQIDSLNQLNKKLIDENITIRGQITSERLRADKAEEMADELTTKVRQGAVIRAREITLRALSNNDREVTRAARATRLRVDFVLAANELANPGERVIYTRITGPDGYVLANSSNATFEFEGGRKTYSASREVDYQNADLPVGIYYEGSGVIEGRYKVDIYADGFLIGSTEVILR